MSPSLTLQENMDENSGSTKTATEVLNTVPSLWDLTLMNCAQNPDLYSTKADFADLRVVNPDIYFTQVCVLSILTLKLGVSVIIYTMHI